VRVSDIDWDAVSRIGVSAEEAASALAEANRLVPWDEERRILAAHLIAHGGSASKLRALYGLPNPPTRWQRLRRWVSRMVRWR
jgi:hypothetical protein